MIKEYFFEDLKDLLNFLKTEAESNLFSEICAVVGINSEEKYCCRFMQNRSKNPENYFTIDPYDYLSFILKNNCFGIFHNHLLGDEKPSDFDIKTSENCCYPFIIYSITTEKFFIYEPENKDYDVNIISRLKELI
jgi:proteasome lid subunit RPN8/RPN11